MTNDGAGPQFQRYSSTERLTKSERRELILEYFDFYRAASENNPELLNQKLPRTVFTDQLAEIGSLLNKHAKALATQPGPVFDFLERNELPPSLSQRLSPEFRAFCLILNALKGWVAAEQLATDRIILGGNARNELRSLARSCIATGNSLEDSCELHHPVRDGRPPIPLSKAAHAKLEGQVSHDQNGGDETLEKLQAVRAKNSWANLRRGCLDLLGETVAHSTSAVANGSKSFARKAVAASGLDCRQILDWLDRTGRGRD